MAQHAHSDAHHDHHHDDGHAHGSFKSYMTGFVLSVILTVIPFWLVMGEVLDSRVATILIVTALAAAQVIVHVIYFLHVNGKAEDGWLLTSVVFTLVVVVIMIAGSVWVMWNMNENMMPAHDMLLETPQLILPESAPAQSVPQ